MASTGSSSSMSDSGDQNLFFEIDLNQIPETMVSLSDDVVDSFQDTYEFVRSCIGNPQPPPGAPAELPAKVRNKSCVCGRRKARDSMVICDGCEKWFHLSCVGMSSPQAVGLSEWICRTCVRDGVGSQRWPLGFISSSGLKRKAEVLDNSGLPSSELHYQRNGFDSQRQFNMIPPFNSGSEGLIHSSLIMSRNFEDADLCSLSGGTLRIKNANTQLKIKELARLPKANRPTGKQEIHISKQHREGQCEEKITSHEVRRRPPGKYLSTKLSAELVMDILQVREFLQRFCEILGISESLSFEELEQEVINPWSAGTNIIKMQEHKTFISHGNDSIADFIPPPNEETNAAFNVENILTSSAIETGSAKETSHIRLESHCYQQPTGVSLTKVHCSLLNVLVGELLDKVTPLVDPNSDTRESKSRRGRKKNVDNLSPVENFRTNMLPLNELTWPELARRYILVVLHSNCNLEPSEITSRERGYVFRCLQGDGGVLCGSLTGVARMEADALLLAEATKQICVSLPSEDNIGLIVEEKDTNAIGAWHSASANANGSSIPEWVLLLEPVRKLPTNVGSRIRNCVYKALDKGPPEWARKILEHSICKEVYKGNAAGPTKRAVLSVLADVSGERPRKKSIKGRNGKSAKTISDIITEQCRSVLRCSAAADKSRAFCNLLGTSLDSNDDIDEGILGSPAMISRPLDFRTIDLRLAVGYYGGSHEAFVEDVREVWHTIYTVYGDRPELIQLAETLSRNFESLYENEILTLVKRCSELANPESSSEEVRKELTNMINCWNGTPKAPWDEGVCKVCGIDKDDESVLLCDTCDAEYHTYCLVPPLESIPQGNWYCPSCVAVRGKSQNASKLTKLITRRRQKGYQGEDSRSSLEALNRLAVTMGEKEYWELSVEERVFLLKFLCDEVLNSAIIREHLDCRADMSLKLQKKLRSLSLELKNLKLREKTLVSRSTEDDLLIFGGVSEVGEDKIAKVLTDTSSTILQQMAWDDTHNNQMTPTGNVLQIEGVSEENKHLSKNCNGGRLEYVKVAGIGNEICDETAVTDDCPILENHSFHAFPTQCYSNFEIDQSLLKKEEKLDGTGRVPNSLDCVNITPTFHAQSTDPSVLHEVQDSSLVVESRKTDIIANITFTPMNLDNLCHSNYSETQNDIDEFGAPNFEANSVRNEISVLVESMASLKSQLLNLSLRREFLGRDSSGRLYWFLGKPDNCPLLVVDGSMPAQQKWRENEGNDFVVEGLSPRPSKSIPFHCDTSSTSREYASLGSDGNDCFNKSSCGVTFSPSCVFYDSDADIKALIECLGESDPIERDLRDSILQFCKQRSQSSQQVGNHVRANSDVKFPDNKACMAPQFLFTKAAAILEKNYGPCFELEPSEISRKQGGESEVITYDDTLYRCECLEPIWPSRRHCISCHQTFYTIVELEEHNDGRCKSGVPVQVKSKEIVESSKEKFMMMTEATRGCKNEMETTEVLRSRKFDISSKSISFQKEEMGCTYNIEEISRKFINKDSRKELFKEIGMSCSNGSLSFVPYESPSLHDSTHIFELADEVDVEASVIPFTFGVHSSQSKFVAEPHHTQISNCYPRRSAACNFKEAPKDNASKADSLTGKGPLSCIPADWDASDSSLVPLSALRPLVGKASQILRMLKINLLDIEALLPEEAFKPTKVHSSNRHAWRTFIKSADSILKMVKATIVFEDMIKTAHLKNGWWYWSSLSAAARTSTMSSLALRVYALDDAIIYERTASGLNGNHTPDNIGSGIKMEVQRNIHTGIHKTRGLENIHPKSGEKERSIEVEIGKDTHQIFLEESNENSN